MRIPQSVKLAGLALMTAFTSSCKDISMSPKPAPSTPPSNPGWRIAADDHAPTKDIPSLQELDTKAPVKNLDRPKP